MTAAHLRYVAKATRWQLIVAGALLGAAMVAPSHVLDAGPFASPHVGIALGTAGIALGAAFTLDDPAATTIAAVPVSLRRRSLLRVALAGVVAAVALSGLAFLSWQRLGFADLASQAGTLTFTGVAGAAVAGRLAGWRRPGLAGAAVVAVLLVSDGLSLLPATLLTGGDPALGDGLATGATAAMWAGLAAATAAGLAWGTRDPAASASAN